MITLLINKIILLLFWFAICVIVRNIFFVVESWVKSNTDNPKKLRITGRGILILGIAIAYVIMSISTGVTI